MTKKRKLRVYETTERNKFIAIDAKTFDEFIDAVEGQVMRLREMKKAGIKLRREGIADDYATFWTTNPRLAKKFGLEVPEWLEEE